MPKQLYLEFFSYCKGLLSVIEKTIPFSKQRIFYIHDVKNSLTGGHLFYKTIQAAICISVTFKIFSNYITKESVYVLDSPNNCLLLEPQDWHTIYDFSEGSILYVLASEEFLLNNHICTEIHYPVAPHLQEGYKDLIVGELPVSELLHSTLLSLPISYAHTISDIKKVCEVINRFEV
jgi:hypothetical protein